MAVRGEVIGLGRGRCDQAPRVRAAGRRKQHRLTVGAGEQPGPATHVEDHPAPVGDDTADLASQGGQDDLDRWNELAVGRL